jgi:HK97 family phage major capsid protein
MNKKEKKELRDALIKKSVAQNYSVAADGGNAINPILANILPPNVDFGGLYELCTKLNTSRNKVNVPQYDTTTVNDTGQYGATAQWLTEGEQYDLTKMSVDQIQLTLNKLGIIIPITDEIEEDAELFVDIVKKTMIDAIKYQVSRAIIYGNGAVSMHGIVGTGDASTIYVSAGADNLATCRKMMGSYYGGKDGVWIFSQDVWEAIALGYGDVNDTILDVNARMLGGYPVIVERAANSGCIILGDFTQYMIAQREIRSSISDTIFYTSDQKLLKSNIRINGTSIWNSEMTLESGDTVAPFVAVDSMNAEEESSEEYNFSSSSSSSEEYSSSSSSSSESSGGYSESSSSSSSSGV